MDVLAVVCILRLVMDPIDNTSHSYHACVSFDCILRLAIDYFDTISHSNHGCVRFCL